MAAMDEHALTNNGVVASSYSILLNPSDLELVSPTLKPLLHELRQAVTNHAEYEGYSLTG